MRPKGNQRTAVVEVLWFLGRMSIFIHDQTRGNFFAFIACDPQLAFGDARRSEVHQNRIVPCAGSREGEWIRANQALTTPKWGNSSARITECKPSHTGL